MSPVTLHSGMIRKAGLLLVLILAVGCQSRSPQPPTKIPNGSVGGIQPIIPDTGAPATSAPQTGKALIVVNVSRQDLSRVNVVGTALNGKFSFSGYSKTKALTFVGDIASLEFNDLPVASGKATLEIIENNSVKTKADKDLDLKIGDNGSVLFTFAQRSIVPPNPSASPIAPNPSPITPAPISPAPNNGGSGGSGGSNGTDLDININIPSPSSNNGGGSGADLDITPILPNPNAGNNNNSTDLTPIGDTSHLGPSGSSDDLVPIDSDETTNWLRDLGLSSWMGTSNLGNDYWDITPVN